MRCVVLVNRIALVAAGVGLLAASVQAQSAYEPERGSKERTQILDAVRIPAVETFGAPVEFVVHDLTVFGDRAYALLVAQRPGGKEIDMASTPDARKYGYDPEREPSTYSLLERKRNQWTVAAFVVSATDVPFYGHPYCETWSEVLPKTWCNGN